MANGSSRSAQAMAVVFSAATASNGSLGIAVGSSNRFSSCSVTLSNTGPLCLLVVLGATDEVSSLKESLKGIYCWTGCGSLERQSGTRFALPARHRKSVSSSCRLSTHLCRFGSRLRLRNSHVSAEQFVTKVKPLPAMYCLKCLMAHKIAIHSRPVGPRRKSIAETWWLAKARTRSSCPTGCISTASAPAELASVYTMKVLFQSENASTASKIRTFFSKWKSPASPDLQAIGDLNALFDANSSILSKSVSGAAVML